jgi:hypothetical protein
VVNLIAEVVSLVVGKYIEYGGNIKLSGSFCFLSALYVNLNLCWISLSAFISYRTVGYTVLGQK